MQLGRGLAILFVTALSQGAQSAPPCPGQGAVCTVTAPLFNFGRHQQAVPSGPILAQGTVSVTCNKLLAQGFIVLVEFDLSGIPAADPRELVAEGGSERLNYGLYLDAARTLPWGDGSRGTTAITDVLELRGTVRDLTRTYTLYGKVEGTGASVAAAARYFNAINAEMKYGATCP